MKLSTDQIAAAKAVLGADPLPSDHPVVPDLEAAFGENTFYLDTNGLLVFEETDDGGESGTDATLVLIAAWTDENRQALGKVEPQNTGVVVTLGAPTQNGAGPA